MPRGVVVRIVEGKSRVVALLITDMKGKKYDKFIEAVGLELSKKVKHIFLMLLVFLYFREEINLTRICLWQVKWNSSAISNFLKHLGILIDDLSCNASLLSVNFSPITNTYIYLFFSSSRYSGTIINTSLLRRLQAQTLPNEAPPAVKTHKLSKIAVTFEPIQRYSSRFRMSEKMSK